MKHIIITRIKFDDDTLFNKYFEVMKNVYIPAIKSQTNKNFKIGFIINNKHINILKKFFGEEAVYFRNFASAKEYCFENNFDIQTRHDCDDWMSNNYVQRLQEIYLENKDRYDKFLIHQQGYKLDYKTNDIYLHDIPYWGNHSNSSGFISSFLTLCQKNVEVFIFNGNHVKMNETTTSNIIYIDEKLTRLVVHGNNIYSTIREHDIKIGNLYTYDISLVVPTFENTEYLIDFINSVKESTNNYNVELLIGIDSCKKTKDFIVSSNLIFDQFVKFYFFEKNVGPYVIRNSLTKIANSNNILFVDSDDILHSDLIKETIQVLKNFDVFRFRFYNFKTNNDILQYNPTNINPFDSIGQLGIRKNIFLSLNGFEPWRCSADSEFMMRENENKLRVFTSNKILYYRRRHNNSITTKQETSYNSNLRNKYKKIIEEKKKNRNIGKLIELPITNFFRFDKNSELKLVNNYDNLNLFNDTKFNQTINISIIIPTFKNPTMLVECLNSIKVGNDCEILVGIDGCEETLNYVKNNKFNENISFFYFDKNVGPYVVRNSLAKIATSDILLFFDSDDIMKDNMISEILNKMKSSDFVKPMYADFTNIPNLTITRSNTYGEGVFAIKKELFLSMNGFEPWPVAADSDFMGRLYKNNKKFSYTNQVTFYRRVHPNSLTQRKDTGLASPLRGKYHTMSKSKKTFGPLSELTIAQFTEVYTNKIYNTDVTIQLPPKKDISNIVFVHPKTIDYSKINEIITKRPEQQKNQPNQKPEPQKPIVVQNKPMSRNVINETKNSQRHSLAKLSIKKK